MTTETTRVMSSKRIYNPDDASQFWDDPVVDEITFIDPSSRYQESVVVFLNKGEDNAAREVHVDIVPPDGGVEGDPGSIYVERIDSTSAVDQVSRFWETIHYLDNTTKGESPPPYFITHLKTHIKRIESPDNPEVWGETERIDELGVIDPSDRYQETVYSVGPWPDEDA